MKSVTSRLAKQSLTGSFNQPSDPSRNQPLIDSNNQPNRRWLENLLTLLFAGICSFLTLDEKCASLHSLSKTIKQIIKQSISQFHTGFLSVSYHEFGGEEGPRTETSIDLLNIKRSGRINYLQYASRVDVDITTLLAGQRRKNLVLSLKKSLISGTLTELSISEYTVYSETTIISELLQEMGRPNVKLEKLDIEILDEHAVHDRKFWGSLKKCNTLKYLNVRIDEHDSAMTFTEAAPYLMSHEHLNESMPDSVETVVINSFVPPFHMIWLWGRSLSDDKVLPNLHSLTIRHINTEDRIGTLNFLDTLTSTVCHTTGNIRPIDSWNGDMGDLSQVSQFDLTDLHVAGCTCTLEILEEMSRPDTNLWPNLRRVNVVVRDMPSDCDILPLMLFASRRSVNKFHYVQEHSETQFALDQQCVRMMATMSELEILRLDSMVDTPMFVDREFTDIIAVSAWSKLRSLDIFTSELSESQLGRILAGCPNATYLAVQLSRRSLSHALVLAMILHFCPFAKRIIIENQNATEMIKDAQAAFKRYPVPTDGPKHLVSLEIMSRLRSYGVLHCLIRQVSRSPLLQHVNMVAVSASPLALCMTRALRHLRCLSQLREDDDESDDVHSNIQSLDCSALEQCFEFRLASAANSPLENLRFRINQSVMRFAECYEDVIAGSYGPDKCYPAFKSGMPGTSQSGRERFYELLFDLLSDSDKAKLIAFDKGEYNASNQA